MKKLLALSAFIVFGLVAVNAQNAPVKKQTQPSATTAPAAATVSAPVAVEAVTEAPITAPVEATATAPKKDAKKECSADEKKACGTKSGKKSCCSGK